MNNDEKILKKIKKLLALSKSSNPHEAAKALEMAQKLMEENRLHQDDVEITESHSDLSFAKRSPRYMHSLISILTKAFGCDAYLSVSNKSKVKFFGQEERPEIASYCFDVLYRKLQQVRKEFIATQSKRLKRSTLIARADSFCEGWVYGVSKNVKDFAMGPREKGLIERYKQRLSEKHNFQASNPRPAGNTRESWTSRGKTAEYEGYQKGRKVTLNHAVKGTETGKLGVNI